MKMRLKSVYSRKTLQFHEFSSENRNHKNQNFRPQINERSHCLSDSVLKAELSR